MSDLWTEASRDYDDEAVQRRLTAGRLAVSPHWPFLAGATNSIDYHNRKALVIDKMAEAVAEAVPDADVTLMEAVESSLDGDWRAMAAVREREAVRKTAADIATCGCCALSWDDSISTSYTPVPSGRCPFEAFHEYDADGECFAIDPDDIPADFPVRPIDGPATGYYGPEIVQRGARKTADISMTRQHFQWVADAISSAPVDEGTRSKLAEHFAGRLANTNGRFDRDRFIKACGPASQRGAAKTAVEDYGASDASKACKVCGKRIVPLESGGWGHTQNGRVDHEAVPGDDWKWESTRVPRPRTAGFGDPIGYTYEADVHCPVCARERFGDALDDPDTEDNEGNPIGAIFPWDEAGGDTVSGEYCGDCGREIIAPVTDREASRRGDAVPFGSRSAKTAAAREVSGSSLEDVVVKVQAEMADGASPTLIVANVDGERRVIEVMPKAFGPRFSDLGIYESFYGTTAAAVRHTAEEHGGYHLEEGDGGWYVVNHIGERKNNEAMSKDKALAYQRALMVNVPGAKEDAERHEENGDKAKHSSRRMAYDNNGVGHGNPDPVKAICKNGHTWQARYGEEGNCPTCGEPAVANDRHAYGPFDKEASLVKHAWSIDQVRKVLADQSAAEIDGVLVDFNTANAITQVYDALSPASQAKVNSVDIGKFGEWAWSKVASVKKAAVDPNALNKMVEFDSPFEVTADGDVRSAEGVYAPSVYEYGDSAPEIDGSGWEFVDGYSGQSGYSGPVMHPSEQLAGGMARDVLNEPGVYCVTEVMDPEDQDSLIGWALLRRTSSKTAGDHTNVTSAPSSSGSAWNDSRGPESDHRADTDGAQTHRGPKDECPICSTGSKTAATRVCRHGHTMDQGCSQCLSDKDWHVEGAKVANPYTNQNDYMVGTPPTPPAPSNNGAGMNSPTAPAPNIPSNPMSSKPRTKPSPGGSNDPTPPPPPAPAVSQEQGVTQGFASKIAIRCFTCGRRMEVGRVTAALRCACGSDDLDLDDSIEATADLNDVPMDTLGDVPAVQQNVTCSSCLQSTTVTATDPAQPLPACPNCGADTLSAAGATTASVTAAFSPADPGFGSIYGAADVPSFETEDGTPVWMWRKGQMVRFYDEQGNQVGPEQSNVAPAVAYALSQGWRDGNVIEWTASRTAASASDYAEHHSYDNDAPTADEPTEVCATCGVHQDAHENPEKYGWGNVMPPTDDHEYQGKTMTAAEQAPLVQAWQAAHRTDQQGMAPTAAADVTRTRSSIPTQLRESGHTVEATTGSDGRLVYTIDGEQMDLRTAADRFLGGWDQSFGASATRKTADAFLAKVNEIVEGIMATNPSMERSAALTLATATVRRYPKMVASAKCPQCGHEQDAHSDDGCEVRTGDPLTRCDCRAPQGKPA